jgi:methyl-accepting chemotaxis protein
VNTSISITHRLYAVSLLIASALLGVAIFATTRMNATIGDAERIPAWRVPQLQRVAALELDVTRVSLQVRHAMLSRSPEELQATVADIGKLRERIERTMKEYENAVSTGEGRERSDAIARSLANFWNTGGRNIALIQNGQRAEAFAFLVDNTIAARNALLADLRGAVEYQQEALAQDIADIESNATATRNWLIGLVIGVVGLLAFAVWHVGALLRRRVQLTQAVAERVRNGDFTQSVRDTTRDEFSPLLAAMQAMQESLARIVSAVRNNAESVATASAQIAQGNQDLSQRTEQQASALQETAASMEQLGSTVQQNARNAQQADQLAREASDVAQRGGSVVGDVVQRVKAINDGSRRIAEIIGTIDGIAFQTNILALNAAVEAARAGEQGRGFAVVAGEVRALAQRSSEAAREIKELITASVEQAEAGATLADQAGRTMQEVVEAIRRVSGIVGEISSASAEQSSGVTQVGSAVNQMDRATQQNASLVEQSAAAADSLQGQAEQLVRAVAVFRLERAAS